MIFAVFDLCLYMSPLTGALKMQDWKMQDKMTVEPKASKNVRKNDTNSYQPEMLLGLSENFVIKTSYR